MRIAWDDAWRDSDRTDWLSNDHHLTASVVPSDRQSDDATQNHPARQTLC